MKMCTYCVLDFKRYFEYIYIKIEMCPYCLAEKDIHFFNGYTQISLHKVMLSSASSVSHFVIFFFSCFKISQSTFNQFKSTRFSCTKQKKTLKSVSDLSNFFVQLSQGTSKARTQRKEAIKGKSREKKLVIYLTSLSKWMEDPKYPPPKNRF